MVQEVVCSRADDKVLAFGDAKYRQYVRNENASFLKILDEITVTNFKENASIDCSSNQVFLEVEIDLFLKWQTNYVNIQICTS